MGILLMGSHPIQFGVQHVKNSTMKIGIFVSLPQKNHIGFTLLFQGSLLQNRLDFSTNLPCSGWLYPARNPHAAAAYSPGRRTYNCCKSMKSRAVGTRAATAVPGLFAAGEKRDAKGHAHARRKSDSEQRRLRSI
ncbi:hypothetical protein OMP38_07215 [Cohnella ginsengisoli]|uniref:Uncharacterized protein n=1 Tax=Cohnella ginsengisoli TaxID=425004 RepID=A0A9X4QLG6_9BACL|nr:hypothetical protein [Cohnella ginsengisoli]MDG0790668.1 hypothetical protein [Cohnella ginsengisoli]